MRIFAQIGLILVMSADLFATAQAPDILIYKGKKLEIFSNPLESYYTEETRPMFILEDACSSTACWRGYIGIWKIIDHKLYLTELRSCCYKEDKVKGDLVKIFGDQFRDGKVLANWFSGELIVPKGKMLYYEHMGYGSVYQKELSISVVKGTVSGIKKYDNSKTRISYLNSDKLSKLVIENLDKAYLNNWEVDLKAYVDIESSNGNVTSASVMKTNIPELSNEIIRIVNKIDDWDILYRYGEQVDMGWIYPVIINKEKIEKYGR